jgi:hypothetical protein
MTTRATMALSLVGLLSFAGVAGAQAPAGLRLILTTTQAIYHAGEALSVTSPWPWRRVT